MSSDNNDQIEQILEVVARVKKYFDCSICLDIVSAPMRTVCGHLFCQACINVVLKKRNVQCPLCGTALSRRNVFLDNYLEKCSTKIQNLITAVKTDTGVDVFDLRVKPRDTKESSSSGNYVTNSGSSSQPNSETRVKRRSNNKQQRSIVGMLKQIPKGNSSLSQLSSQPSTNSETGNKIILDERQMDKSTSTITVSTPKAVSPLLTAFLPEEIHHTTHAQEKVQAWLENLSMSPSTLERLNVEPIVEAGDNRLNAGAECSKNFEIIDRHKTWPVENKETMNHSKTGVIQDKTIPHSRRRTTSPLVAKRSKDILEEITSLSEGNTFKAPNNTNTFTPKTSTERTGVCSFKKLGRVFRKSKNSKLVKFFYLGSTRTKKITNSHIDLVTSPEFLYCSPKSNRFVRYNSLFSLNGLHRNSIQPFQGTMSRSESFGNLPENYNYSSKPVGRDASPVAVAENIGKSNLDTNASTGLAIPGTKSVPDQRKPEEFAEVVTRTNLERSMNSETIETRASPRRPMSCEAIKSRTTPRRASLRSDTQDSVNTIQGSPIEPRRVLQRRSKLSRNKAKLRNTPEPPKTPVRAKPAIVSEEILTWDNPTYIIDNSNRRVDEDSVPVQSTPSSMNETFVPDTNVILPTYVQNLEENYKKRTLTDFEKSPENAKNVTAKKSTVSDQLESNIDVSKLIDVNKDLLKKTTANEQSEDSSDVIRPVKRNRGRNSLPANLMSSSQTDSLTQLSANSTSSSHTDNAHWPAKKVRRRLSMRNPVRRSYKVSDSSVVDDEMSSLPDNTSTPNGKIPKNEEDNLKAKSKKSLNKKRTAAAIDSTPDRPVVKKKAKTTEKENIETPKEARPVAESSKLNKNAIPSTSHVDNIIDLVQHRKPAADDDESRFREAFKTAVDNYGKEKMPRIRSSSRIATSKNRVQPDKFCKSIVPDDSLANIETNLTQATPRKTECKFINFMGSSPKSERKIGNSFCLNNPVSRRENKSYANDLNVSVKSEKSFAHESQRSDFSFNFQKNIRATSDATTAPASRNQEFTLDYNEIAKDQNLSANDSLMNITAEEKRFKEFEDDLLGRQLNSDKKTNNACDPVQKSKDYELAMEEDFIESSQKFSSPGSVLSGIRSLKTTRGSEIELSKLRNTDGNGMTRSDSNLEAKSLACQPSTSRSETATRGQPGTSPERKLCFVCTGLTAVETNLLIEFTKMFNAEFISQFDKRVTHVIVELRNGCQAPKTLKYLQGVAHGKWIVGFEWIAMCVKKRELIDEEPYEAIDSDSLGPGPRNSRLRKCGLFERFAVLCLGPILDITMEQYEDILRASGATVVKSMDELAAVRNKLKAIVITEPNSREDVLSWHRRTDAIVITEAWFVDCISQYKLISFYPYLHELLEEERLLALGYPMELIEPDEHDSTGETSS